MKKTMLLFLLGNFAAVSGRICAEVTPTASHSLGGGKAAPSNKANPKLQKPNPEDAKASIQRLIDKDEHLPVKYTEEGKTSLAKKAKSSKPKATPEPLKK